MQALAVPGTDREVLVTFPSKVRDELNLWGFTDQAPDAIPENKNNELFVLNLSDILKTPAFRGIYEKDPMDFAFIEIPEDLLSHRENREFLRMSKNFSNFKDVYVIQYPDGNYYWDYGEIKKVNEHQFGHTANTDEGSSGAPVLSYEGEVLGLHTGYNEEKVVGRKNNKDLVSENSALKITYIVNAIYDDYRSDPRNHNRLSYFSLNPSQSKSKLSSPNA